MSTTLCARKTPIPTREEWTFSVSIKHIFGKRFYGHDGSLSGELLTIGKDHLSWLEGLLAGSPGDEQDRRRLQKMIDTISSGRTVDIWIE